MSHHTCGNILVTKTSWSSNAPARRFLCCAKFQEEGGCNYMEWIDQPLEDHYRLTLVGFMHDHLRIHHELSGMRALVARLQQQINARYLMAPIPRPGIPVITPAMSHLNLNDVPGTSNSASCSGSGARTF